MQQGGTIPVYGRRWPPRPARRETRRRWSEIPKPSKALLEYYKLGATRLLIRGYDPRPDAIQYGEVLILCIRELVATHDAAPASGMRHPDLSVKSS
jgi:hypothetical protein